MSVRVLVRGSGDVGSAVAHALFTAGHRPAIHDAPEPLAARRLMAFSDALFDGSATLDGVTAWRCAAAELTAMLAEGKGIPVTGDDFATTLGAVAWDVLVDARMRKRSVPEGQRGLAPQVIGLGPNFTVGDNADLAVETSYEDLGRVLRSGSTLPLSGEPRPLAGVGRERYVYAPVAGLFQAILGLRAPVSAGQPVARIGEMVLAAPIGGAVRSLSRSGIAVTVGAKVIEIDPRGPEAVVGGIGERPRRIAQGVLEALGIPSSYTFAPAKCH